MPSGFFFGRLRSYVRYDGDAVINFAGAVTYLANGAVGSTKYSGTYLVGTTTAEMNISYGYTYNEDGSLATTIIQANSSTGESAFTYDSFGRLTLVETTFEDGVRYPVDFSAEKAYTYLAEGDATTGLVSTYTTTVGGGTRTYTFTYDVNGNITKIVDSAGYTCRYVYDDLGQLIREDDGYTNHTYLYTYDNAGNILRKERYNYTGAGITPVFGGSSVTYTYGSTNGWGDQLIAFGGSTIIYDANGNPLQYYNGYNFTWTNGTELATAVNGTYNLSFSYDDNGVRVRKVVNGVEHIYTANGTQILTEEWDGNLLVYLYDASGSPIGMEYRNHTYPEGGFDLYLFETNLQGDVIGVYNELGEKIISYTYDAWGNCTMTASANVTAGFDFAATFNPFRYRGYYYDTELGLYYLNARYYDSNTGRFISADKATITLETPEELSDKNLYAYCDNNPIMRVDYSGEFWNVFVGAVIGGVVGAAMAILSEGCSVIAGAKKDINWEKVIASAVIGAVEGALVALIPTASSLISAGSNMLESFVGGILDGDSLGDIITSTVVSGVFGLAGAANPKELIKGGKIINEGAKATLGILSKRGVHPVVKKAAKDLQKTAIKYLGKAFGQEFASGLAYTCANDFAAWYTYKITSRMVNG